MKRLETAAAGRAESEEQTANGFSRERETEDRWGEEMRRRRCATCRALWSELPLHIHSVPNLEDNFSLKFWVYSTASA